MKKSIISMMMIGMMLIGTTNSFGSVKNSHFQSPKTEKVVKNSKKQDKNCDCKTCKDLVKKGQLVGVGRGWQQKQQQKQQKVQKKNQFTCKTCQKQQQKSGPTCKIQPNTRQTNRK